MRRKLRNVIVPVWVFVSFWVGFFGVLGIWFCESAHAGTAPGLEDYLAVSQAEDCAVVRAMVAKARAQLEKSRVELASDAAAWKERHAALVACTSRKGIRSLSDPRDKRLAAELCPAEYRGWLKPGYGRLVAEQDIFETSNQIHKLMWHLNAYCRPTQTVVARQQ